MEGTQTVTTLFSNLFEIFHIKDEIRGEKNVCFNRRRVSMGN